VLSGEFLSYSLLYHIFNGYCTNIKKNLILTSMKFIVGEVVWITTSLNQKEYVASAIVLDAYKGIPRVFMNNKEKSKLEDEDICAGWIYDVMYDGNIEIGVLAEWLHGVNQYS